MATSEVLQLFNELRKVRNEAAHGFTTPEEVSGRLKSLGLDVDPSKANDFIRAASLADNNGATIPVPHFLLEVLETLLTGQRAQVICDPWASLGTLTRVVQDATGCDLAYALTPNSWNLEMGKVLAPRARWILADPLEAIDRIPEQFDVAVSILPWGYRLAGRTSIVGPEGQRVEIRDDFGGMLLAVTANKLTDQGIGLYVVPPSFFTSTRSVLGQFQDLGLAVEAALALPSGSFGQTTMLTAYLLFIRKSPSRSMFVAQLTTDARTNSQILTNLRERHEGGAIELGRFVDPTSFRGIDVIRLRERFARAKEEQGVAEVALGDVASSINLGRTDEGFAFEELPNALYIPLVGNSAVVDRLDDLKIKAQNYAQVVIDPTRSNATFIARFLNTELGREGREHSKSGAVIFKLTKQALQKLPVLIPDLQMQADILAIDARIVRESNILLGLEIELSEITDALWSDPRGIGEVEKRLATFSKSLGGKLREHTAESLEEWFETLPFPMASILRLWQATGARDFRTKHDHLLHFFEATAEFCSIIALSAFMTENGLPRVLQDKITKALHAQSLSLERATFGTWKVILEVLGKETREMLEASSDWQLACGALFADVSLKVPEMIGDKRLVQLLARTNKHRNDWKGHAGILGQEEARQRNDILMGELQELRDIMGDMWNSIDLLHAFQCRPVHGVFQNDVTLLKGSNSEFLNETRDMATWLDVEQLYLSQRDSPHPLKLLPLIQMGPSPEAAMNAVYFFSRVDKDGLRFISYHFAKEPERRVSLDQDLKLLFEPPSK